MVLNTEGRICRIDLATFAIISTNINDTTSISWDNEGSSILAARKNGEILKLSVGDDGFGPKVILMDSGKNLSEFWYRNGRIFTLHDDVLLRVWDGGSLAQLTELKFAKAISAAAVSEDGSAVTVAIGNTVRLYADRSGEFVETLSLSDHAARVNALAFSRDGSVLVSGGNDRTIRVIDAISGVNGSRAIQAVYTSPMLDVRQLVVDSAGKNVFAAFENGHGGPVPTRDLTDDINDRLPFWTGIFGIGESKAAELAPHIWAELYAGASQFFRQKDNPVRESVFGGDRQNWKLALPQDAFDRLPEDDDTEIGEGAQITAIQRLTELQIFDTYTLPFSIDKFFEYDGDEQLTYTATTLSSDLVVNLNRDSGEVTIGLKAHSKGIGVVRLTAADSKIMASQGILVVYSARNHAPAAPTIRATTRPGKDVDIKARDYATDPDGDTIDLVSVGVATRGKTSIPKNSKQQIRYTPSSGFIGTDRFEYVVSDGQGGTAKGIVEVTVGNTPPTAPTIRVTTRPGKDVDIKARDYATDPDGDTIDLVSVGVATRGKASIPKNSKQQIRYTPSSGFIGTDGFEYVVSDGQGGTTKGIVEVTVVNTPPTAPTIRVTTRPGKDVDIKARDYATDPDGDTIDLVSVGVATRGKASIPQNSKQQIRYTPSSGFIGTDRFEYVVSDGQGGTAKGIVEVTVVNTPPTAPTIRVRVRNGLNLDINIGHYVTDADGDSISLTSVGNASSGTARIRLNSTTQIQYTAKNRFQGIDQFTYTITDGFGQLVTGIIQVEVH